MGFASYRGAVTTVHHVMMLDGFVLIRCEACGHIRRARARWMVKDQASMERFAAMPLGKPVTGFYCTKCRAGTKVMIQPERTW